ncbi:unnamed protein product, partial [Prorocentrum cordatum]
CLWKEGEWGRGREKGDFGATDSPHGAATTPFGGPPREGRTPAGARSSPRQTGAWAGAAGARPPAHGGALARCGSGRPAPPARQGEKQRRGRHATQPSGHQNG